MKNTDLSVKILQVSEMLDPENGDISKNLLCLYLVQHYAAPNIGTTILYWFRYLSTVLSPTENSSIQGLFKAFGWFSSTFQGIFNLQGLFKKAL